MTDGGDLRELRALAMRLAHDRQADIFVYSGELARPGDGPLTLASTDRPRHRACLLLISTLGGSADAAYRLARTLRRRYARMTVYVDDYCKGAGMLLAIAATELVISDFGELGPLDLVEQRPIEPGRGESGLAPLQALHALRAEAQATFEHHLTRLRSRRILQVTSRVAIDQASAMAVGLLAPVFSHIDPLQVAEVDRALRTATLYAERLGASNFEEGGLDRLLTGYPSQDFVIDREEASDVLRTVRAPSPEEAIFLTHVEPIMSDRRTQGKLIPLDEALTTLEGAPTDDAGATDDSAVRAGPIGESTAPPSAEANPDRTDR